MLKGSNFDKVKAGRKKLGYTVTLDPSGTFLKAGTKKLIEVTQIKEIRLGFQTQEFLTHGESQNIPEQHALSIVYQTPSSPAPKILNLVAEGPAQRAWWNDTLEKLLDHVRGVTGEAFAVLHPWTQNLRDGKTDISWKGAQDLLESIGMKCSWAEAKKYVKEFDTNGDSRLDFAEFVRFMRKLRSHSAITELFKVYAKKGEMGVAELQAFFTKEQKESLSAEEAETLIAKFSISDSNKSTLDEDGFQLLISSRDNDPWNPKHLERSHDMSKSMTDYFINSSHNTYLVGDQLKSDSSIEMYVRALQLGCRCVELDLWDGPNDEPIVHHGYTLTSKILFRDILKLIKSQGFHKSPYPIILSLENHCSLPVQDRVAQHLEKILGDMVVKNPSGQHMDQLPSPEALKGKVLIKAKAIATSTVEADEEIEEDALQSEDTRAAEPKEAKKTSKISERLSKLVFLSASHFKSFEECKKWEPYEMSSFSEPKTFKIIAKGDQAIAELRGYNERCLSRIYPKGTRFDSSNYDPILPWLAGCQIVALNFQTSDSFPLWINYAKFKVNGHAGYNLRPKWKDFSPPSAGEVFSRPKQSALKVSLHILGGRMLPQRSKFDLLDPYVVVTFHDGSARPASFTTKVVTDNALNPEFDFKCETVLQDAQDTFVSLAVYDQNPGTDLLVCHWAAPVTSLRSGYRAAHMLDSNFNPVSRGIGHVLLKIDTAN